MHKGIKAALHYGEVLYTPVLRATSAGSLIVLSLSLSGGN